MLLLLTKKCSEECTHCMMSATKNGDDINIEYLQKAKQMISDLGYQSITISGGEITESNNWYDNIKNIITTFPNKFITLLSNGTFIFDDTKTKQVKDLLKNKNVKVMQITSNSRYYPSYQKIHSATPTLESLSKKLCVFVNWQQENLIYLGRAKQIMQESEIIKAPGCAPLITRYKQLDAIIQNTKAHIKQPFDRLLYFNKMLELSGYLCKPMIDCTNGNVYINESPECMKLFNLDDLDGMNLVKRKEFYVEAFNKINNMKFCDNCKGRKNVKPEILKILNL